MTNLTMKAVEAVIDKGAEFVIRARLLLEDGTPMTAADMASITMKIFNALDLSTAIVIGSGSVTSRALATSLISDTLSTSNNWTEDTDGYNFSDTYDTSTFLSAGSRFKVIYKFTTSASGVVYLPVFLGVRNINF